MRNKKTNNLKKYCKIKVDIEFVFLFFINSKTKYKYDFLISIPQTPTRNHNFYKTHKSNVQPQHQNCNNSCNSI